MVLTYKGLKIEIPYDVIQVEDIELIETINDHASLKLKLLVEEGKILEYINKNINNEKVTVISIDETTKEETRLFIGEINEVFMSYEGELHIMELKCISYTKEFDIKKNSRTFCNLDMTYEEVIQKVLEPYNKKDFKDNIAEGQAIGEYILQYEETDWEFLKRIASHFNGVLLSESTADYGRFHFGIPKIDKENEIDIDDYEVVKDINTYNKREALEIEDNFLPEYTKWDVISPKKLILGEQVKFNQVKCVVAKIHIEVYKEEIRTIYTLGIEGGLRNTYKVNHNIFGMSIPAIVKDVKGNTMAVHFEIDPVYETYENQKYFTYAIESSAWYCMPEKESKVHIYYSTNYEKDSIAIHAVRAQGADAKYAGRTQNPDDKSFSNVTGSEMKLTPSDMSFAADDGKSICLTLAQSGDVTLIGKNINFTATENLELGMRDAQGDAPPFRPQNIKLSAKNKIEMSKGGIGIQMAEQTFLKGPIIKYEGTIKDAVELPDDIAHRNDDDEKTINEINDQAKEAQIQKIDAAKQKMGFGAIALAIGVVAIAVAATVLTGGLALAAVGVGVTAALVGASELSEGSSNYTKSQSGDYSKSYNFMRDTVCGGNETLYNIVKYGSVLISSVIIAIGTGGAATEVFLKMGLDAGGDVAFNMLADYADDGKINGNIGDYVESAIMSASMSNVSIGVMNKFKKLEKAGELSCKTIGKIRLASDVALDMGQQLATTGDANFTSTLIKKYIGNKICFSDPVDGATGSLYIPATDIVLPDIHEEFKIERKYESVNKRRGLLGIGWTNSFETYLNFEEEKISVLCNDGHVETFDQVNDEWVNDKGGAKIYSLKNEGNYWIFKATLEKKTYRYNNLGKLIDITDKNNNRLSVSYIGENIESIKTFSNYKVFFTYKDGKVIEIKDDLDRIVQYKYDGDYLTDVIHVDKGITRYTYDKNGYINTITDQNGHTYTKNFFDKKGRVIRQDFPNDDSCKITYDDSEKEVTFYYEKSKRTEKTRFNKDGLITHLFYEDGSTEEYKYDDCATRCNMKSIA